MGQQRGMRGGLANLVANYDDAVLPSARKLLMTTFKAELRGTLTYSCHVVSSSKGGVNCNGWRGWCVVVVAVELGVHVTLHTSAVW